MGGTFAGGGYPFLTRFPKGGYEYFAKVQRGDIHFLHTKKNTEQGKMSLSRDSPDNFARFTPAALKSWGVPILDGEPKGGIPEFYGDSEGGMHFLWAFSQKVPPTPTRNSYKSLSSCKTTLKNSTESNTN